MTDRGVFEEAGRASAEGGQVLLDGPDGISIFLTPDVAEGTARALMEAASRARTQLAEEAS